MVKEGILRASTGQGSHIRKKNVPYSGTPGRPAKGLGQGRSTFKPIPHLLLWALIGSLLPWGKAFAQDHRITPWRHNRAGAVTMSFDDGYTSQLTIAAPLLNARGLKGTYFVLTSATEVTWDQWRQLASQGHEIASHTVTHPDLTSLSDSELRYELSESQRVINQNIPSQSCLSFAYPYTVSDARVQSITSEYYVAARGGWAGDEGGNFNFYEDLEPFWPWPPDVQFGQFRAVDFYNTAGDGTPFFVPVSTLDVKLDTAMTYHAWYVMYLHTIPDEAYYIDYLTTLLDHIVARNLWMATYGEAAKYMRERLASTVGIVSSEPSALRLSLTNSLDGSMYNEPLTIRSIVPSNWVTVSVTQGASSTIVNSTVEGADTVVYYDAIPNGGAIILVPSEGQGQAALSAVSVSPATVLGGASSTGTVTLDGPAPAGGAVVGLTSSDTAAAQVPASVTVVAGATTATFTVTTSPVVFGSAVTITALYDSVSRTATLTVTAPVVVPSLSAVSVSPAMVLGGASSTGTVTLDNPAPAGGAAVGLSSDNTAAQVPASVTVAAGATTATFTVTTSSVSSDTAVTITALYDSVSRTATLTVTAPAVVPALSSISLVPTSVVGGSSSTGTIALSGPAPAGGAVVGLSSNNSAAQVPASVTVVAGATTATFTVTTIPVTSNRTLGISAVYQGNTLTATLRVTAPVASLLTLDPSSVQGGSPSTGTVSLNGPAPAGGTVVTLSSSRPAVAPVPASVTVPAGATTATFTITTTAVTSTRSVTISARRGVRVRATLTVTR